MKKLAVLFVTLALGATACGTDDPPQKQIGKPGDPPQSVADLPECRNVLPDIVGHVASIYQARDPEGEFYILIVADVPTCATDEEGVNESGIIPSQAPVEAARCPICDGEPMPSIRFPGLN
jgi:hypothetical protein